MRTEVYRWLVNELGIKIDTKELRPYTNVLTKCYEEIHLDSGISYPCWLFLRRSKLLDIIKQKGCTIHFMKYSLDNYKLNNLWRILMHHDKGLMRLLIKYGYVHTFLRSNK